MSVLISVKNQTGEILAKAITSSTFKAPMAIAVGAVEYLFGQQNMMNMAIILTLITLDLMTAIGSEFKVGNEIESRKALKTVTKTVVYSIMVAGAHLAGKVIGVEFLDGIATSFLALTELISILENIAKMGYTIPSQLLNKAIELKK